MCAHRDNGTLSGANTYRGQAVVSRLLLKSPITGVSQQYKVESMIGAVLVGYMSAVRPDNEMTRHSS